MADSPAREILEQLGGATNVESLTHCATRLRFQLRDASAIDDAKVGAIPGVMGAVPQSGDRYQVVIGGAVDSVYNDIMALPEMKTAGSRQLTDDEVKAAARAGGPRGRFAFLDNFFEFLSDSFRPIIGALLGASLFITFMSLMSTLGVIGNWADPRTNLPVSWQFVNLMWQGVFVFLPLMVAYNASKKVDADPWVGFGIMAVLMLPAFAAMAKDPGVVTQSVAGFDVTTVKVFGVPLALRDYSSQVFPPLLMAAVLGPLYKLLKKIIPASLHLIFVPFLAMLIMIPLTAFVIGPIGIYAGAGIAGLLQSINSFSPLIFAIIIPLAYPFMVPLGLHWPLNAVMLLNIKNLGYDFIQGPMGAWNFACFGATAGVLWLAARERDAAMRQTATGALAAGLLGGISEPSLYGIHLRFKRIYPSMLVGCLVGGIIIGLGGGLKTNAFVFTSLLTIPAFNNIALYAVAVAASFLTAMALVIFRGYRTAEERQAALAGVPAGGAAEANDVVAERVAVPASERTGMAPSATGGSTAVVADAVSEPTGAAAGAPEAAAAPAEAAAAKPGPAALAAGAVTLVGAPVAGRVVPLAEVPDPVFAAGTVGQGVGIDPSGDTVVAPADGTIIVAQSTGHAFGLRLDNGLELLIHVGIDTVNLKGEGFEVLVAKGDQVTAGQPLVRFDRAVIEAAGYSLVTPVLVTNLKKVGSVARAASGDVAQGDPVLLVTAKEA